MSRYYSTDIATSGEVHSSLVLEQKMLKKNMEFLQFQRSSLSDVITKSLSLHEQCTLETYARFIKVKREILAVSLKLKNIKVEIKKCQSNRKHGK